MNKQYSIGIEILILILSVLTCLSISSLLFGLSLSFFGLDITQLDQKNADVYLISALFTQLGGFVGGFVLFLKLTKKSFKSIINIDFPELKMVAIIIGLLIICIPLMSGLTYINSFLKDIIPNNSFILAEKEIHLSQAAILENTGTLKLFIKILLIAFLPAVAEELLFRGVLLKKIKEASKNEHYAVFVTAGLFAVIHFQPSHLLSMIFLGAVMGYIYTRTNNLFYSMLFHFMFNSMTIASAHYFGV